jgi:hypothetical protein
MNNLVDTDRGLYITCNNLSICKSYTAFFMKQKGIGIEEKSILPNAGGK